MNIIEGNIELFYKHFCKFTDGGVSVQFTSDILKDEDGLGITLDDFLKQSTIIAVEEFAKSVQLEYDEAYDMASGRVEVKDYDGYNQAVADQKQKHKEIIRKYLEV